MLPLHRNALMYRAWCTLSRPGKLWALLIALIAVLGLGYLFIELNQRFEYGEVNRTKVFRYFAMFVLAIQVFLAFVAALALAVDSVAIERFRNTYEFLVSLPLSPSDKLLGLGLGSTLGPALAWLLMVPVGIVASLMGDVDMVRLAWLYVIMLTGFAAINTIGVVLGMGLGKTGGAWLMIFVLVIVGFIPLGFIGESEFKGMPVFAFSPYSLYAGSILDSADLKGVFAGEVYHFYSVPVPWQLCPVVF